MALDEASGESGRGFHFLFRTDKGSIDRATWWRGTIPIVAIAAITTLVWLLVRPYTRDALHQPPAAALFAYLYLLAFGFCTLILLVCQYNLSAKRFAARHLPGALAGLLPASLLLAGSLDWYIPRSQGAWPDWSVYGVYAVVVAITMWNVAELGVRRDAPRR